jgi:hypothetical protein
VLGLLAVGLLVALFAHPAFTLAFLVVLMALTYRGTVVIHRHYRSEAAARRGEDIGTFARALDRRAPEFDPWIVRAVWDAIQPYVHYGDGHLPLRPSDDLVDDLMIDPDDLEELAVEVARRVGRSTADWSKNPRARSVRTVADLIALVAHQQREAAA